MKKIKNRLYVYLSTLFVLSSFNIKPNLRLPTRELTLQEIQALMTQSNYSIAQEILNNFKPQHHQIPDYYGVILQLAQVYPLSRMDELQLQILYEAYHQRSTKELHLAWVQSIIEHYCFKYDGLAISLQKAQCNSDYYHSTLLKYLPLESITPRFKQATPESSDWETSLLKEYLKQGLVHWVQEVLNNAPLSSSLRKNHQFWQKQINELKLASNLNLRILENMVFPLDKITPDFEYKISQDFSTLYGKLEQIQFADLNGDGLRDAVVTLIYSSLGGNSSFYRVETVIANPYGPFVQQSISLGKCVQIEAIHIRPGHIQVHYLGHNTQPEKCYPTESKVQVIKVFPRFISLFGEAFIRLPFDEK